MEYREPHYSVCIYFFILTHTCVLENPRVLNNNRSFRRLPVVWVDEPEKALGQLTNCSQAQRLGWAVVLATLGGR